MASDVQAGTGLTVAEARTAKFMTLVESGEDPKVAAKEVGVTLASLRATGTLAKACKQLLERVEQEKLLDKKTYEMIARGRALELMMQDENLQVALGAVKVAIGQGPGVAIQINNGLKTDPDVVAALKSLQLDVEGEEQES